MRLVDADALVEQVCLDGDCTQCKTGVNEKVCKWNMFRLKDVIDCLEHAPTIDAVPVVRCKDCKWKADTIGESWCDFHEFTILSDDDYCYHGERRRR